MKFKSWHHAVVALIECGMMEVDANRIAYTNNSNEILAALKTQLEFANDNYELAKKKRNEAFCILNAFETTYPHTEDNDV